MVSKILKNVKNLAVVSVVFSSVMFVGCGESESDLKNMALEKCKDYANRKVDSVFKEVKNVEFVSIEDDFEKQKIFKGDFKVAKCKISYILGVDNFMSRKKGDVYEDETKVEFEKQNGKWVASPILF